MLRCNIERCDMRRSNLNPATNPSTCDLFQLFVCSYQRHYADVLQALVNLKEWADCTNGMTAMTSMCEMNKGTQAIGSGEGCVRPQRTEQTRASNNRHGTAASVFAVVGDTCIGCRDARGMDTHLWVSRDRRRGCRDYPSLQSAHRSAGRHTNKLGGV